jgi:hypothetical protein
VTEHQNAWDSALATEHQHQHELLATLRRELGAFARECADALTTLDAFVGGLSGAVSVAASAQKGYAQAKLLRDLALKMPGETAEGRSDRELLERVCTDDAFRAELERTLGPAPIALLQALRPLSRWVPTIASLRRGEVKARELVDQAGKDLIQVLDATATLTASEGEALAADAGALAIGLRDTVEHVEGAVRAIKEGKLEQVLAEARKQLEGDLQELHGVIERAEGAAEEWVRARRAEHDELTEEVRVKLERIERMRKALGLIMPHLQAVARSLATAERFVAVEHRLLPEHAVAAEASQMSLLLDLASLWETVLPGGPPGSRAQRSRTSRRPLLIAAIVVLIGAGIGIAFAVSGGGKKKAVAPVSTSTTTQTTTTSAPTTTTPAVTVPAAPKVSPVQATFNPSLRATFYTVNVSEAGGGAPSYAWKLTPPKGDPTCNKFTIVKPNESVWHHADTDGCNHALMGPAGHLGTVSVLVENTFWKCTATFFGTNTTSGPPAQRCTKV